MDDGNKNMCQKLGVAWKRVEMRNGLHGFRVFRKRGFGDLHDEGSICAQSKTVMVGLIVRAENCVRTLFGKNRCNKRRCNGSKKCSKVSELVWAGI